MAFYRFDQNNSGGDFECNDKVCHRVYVEASSPEEANRIAEELGCYFDGVDNGMDCSCCGDRWYRADEIEFERTNEKWNGHEVYLYPKDKKSKSVDPLKSLYKGYEWSEEPTFKEYKISGKIKINSIEEYAQYYANQWGGWTSPDVRIFFKDGTVKEFNKKN